MHKSDGFTIIELMISLAVAAIILTVAVPSFRALIQGTRATTQTNALVAALSFSRSEAVKRGTPVSLCPSANQTSCSGAGDWSVGWIVFRDPNDNGAPESSDDLLRIWPALEGAATMSGPTSLRYRGSGGAAGATTFSYSISGAASRLACVNVVGRIQVRKDAASC